MWAGPLPPTNQKQESNDKMDEKPNQGANYQSSKLDENESQKLEEESQQQSECKFAFIEWNSLDQFIYYIS